MVDRGVGLRVDFVLRLKHEVGLLHCATSSPGGCVPPAKVAGGTFDPTPRSLNKVE